MFGKRFRFGLFSVSDHDMRLIARAMGTDNAVLGLNAGQGALGF